MRAAKTAPKALLQAITDPADRAVVKGAWGKWLVVELTADDVKRIRRILEVWGYDLIGVDGAGGRQYTVIYSGLTELARLEGWRNSGWDAAVVHELAFTGLCMKTSNRFGVPRRHIEKAFHERIREMQRVV